MTFFKKALIAAAIASVVGSVAAGSLPGVHILATGGTIAGSAASTAQTTGYEAGKIGIQTLIDAVPQIKEIATVNGEQIFKMSSNNMMTSALLKLSNRVNELLKRDDVQGIVITHGTDTLEETAYFLNLTVKSDKPVILVGAMRPATAISADGPMNLLNAVRVAISKEAAGKGVLIVMNDTINGARDGTKTNTTNVATFKAPELGVLGYIAGGDVKFYKASTRRHTTASEFDVKGMTELPRVDIVYSHVNADDVMVNAAVKAGAQGIVHDGTGNGSIHENTEKGLVKAQKKGIVIVRSARVGNGPTVPSIKRWTDEKFLDGDTLNAQKARLLLQLALTKTKDLKEIQRMFNEY